MQQQSRRREYDGSPNLMRLEVSAVCKTSTETDFKIARESVFDGVRRRVIRPAMGKIKYIYCFGIL